MKRNPVTTFTNVLIATGFVLLLMAMAVSDRVSANDARPLGPVITEETKVTVSERPVRASQVLFWSGATLFVAGFVGRVWSVRPVSRITASRDS